MFFDKILNALKLDNLNLDENHNHDIPENERIMEQENYVFIEAQESNSETFPNSEPNTKSEPNPIPDRSPIPELEPTLEVDSKPNPNPVPDSNPESSNYTSIVEYKQIIPENESNILESCESEDYNVEEKNEFISDRIMIPGLHIFFINVMRDIIESGKISPVPIMREYHLSKEDVHQILEEAEKARLIDHNHNVLVSKDFFERFVDSYNPSMYICEHCVFDKELLICIGEIAIENGAESLYDEFEPEVILDYLIILEKLGVLSYNSNKNIFESMISLDEFKKIYQYIPDSCRKDLTCSSLEELDQFDGHDFEYACADILRKNGFIDVIVTRGSGDHGIDILATKYDITYAIQCKCYSSNIGNLAIEQANSGRTIYKRDISVVLTNQYFTNQAKKEAADLGVKLWDRDKLYEMIEKSSKHEKQKEM